MACGHCNTGPYRGRALPHATAPGASCYAPRMKVATMPPRSQDYGTLLPEGHFWDDEEGRIVTDEDDALMELL